MHLVIISYCHVLIFCNFVKNSCCFFLKAFIFWCIIDITDPREICRLFSNMYESYGNTNTLSTNPKDWKHAECKI